MLDPSPNHAQHGCLYVLRMWREDRESPWRITVRIPQRQAHQGFADINALVEFLISEQHGLDQDTTK